MTHRRPLAESNASRSPTGNGSITSLRPRSRQQWMQEEYTRWRRPYFPLLIRYASMIVPYFTSMFGTSHSGSFPSRR
jgi:hypothetical protein